MAESVFRFIFEEASEGASSSSKTGGQATQPAMQQQSPPAAAQGGNAPPGREQQPAASSPQQPPVQRVPVVSGVVPPVRARTDVAGDLRQVIVGAAKSLPGIGPIVTELANAAKQLGRVADLTGQANTGRPPVAQQSSAGTPPAGIAAPQPPQAPPVVRQPPPSPVAPPVVQVSPGESPVAVPAAIPPRAGQPPVVRQPGPQASSPGRPVLAPSSAMRDRPTPPPVSSPRSAAGRESTRENRDGPFVIQPPRDGRRDEQANAQPRWTVDARTFQQARSAWSEGKSSRPPVTQRTSAGAASATKPIPPAVGPTVAPTSGPGPAPVVANAATTATVARTAGAGAGASAGAGAGGAAGALAPVAAGAVVVAGALIVAARAAVAFRDRMNDATSRMAGYSAQIQAAQAANEVRSMMGQMGALQRVQGGVSMETRLARLEETKGDAGAAWQRAGDTINGTLLQVFQPILQTGADLLTVGVDRMQKMMEILGEWLPNLGVMESLHAEAEKIRARWESEDMNAAGPMFQFFGGVPDLELTDSAVQGANIERTGVAFDFLRGEELP